MQFDKAFLVIRELQTPGEFYLLYPKSGSNKSEQIQVFSNGYKQNIFCVDSIVDDGSNNDIVRSNQLLFMRWHGVAMHFQEHDCY
jgi:hypothetical protein